MRDEVSPCLPAQEVRAGVDAEQTPFVPTHTLPGRKRSRCCLFCKAQDCSLMTKAVRKRRNQSLLVIYRTACFKNARLYSAKLFGFGIFGDTNHLKHSWNKEKTIPLRFKSWPIKPCHIKDSVSLKH